MQSSRFFPYSWHIDDKQLNVTCMRVYGLNESNENICIRIDDFTPFCYLELPDHINWTEELGVLFGAKITKMMGATPPLHHSLQYKKKLYYASFDPKGDRKLYPFYFLAFSNKSEIMKLSYKIKNEMYVNPIGMLKVKIHEHNANEVLQLVCRRDIPTAGWIQFRGKKIDEESKITSCDHEYMASWKSLKAYEQNTVPKPLILGFDIEVNSTIPTTFPQASRAGDKIFQISCVLARQGDTEDMYKNFLLSLGEPDQSEVGDNTTILMFETEADLLDGFTEFVNEYKPNIITGYNIYGFDINYMLARSRFPCQCEDTFTQMGFLKDTCSKVSTVNWASSAYGKQEFEFLDAEGRLFIDLLPIIKRDHKLDTYTLKSISNKFIGDTKDDLSPKGIFKCYLMGLERDKLDNFTPKAKKAMGVVGKYCMKDSILVVKLINKLQTWIGLVEMAKVCNVPIVTLYTGGQQIKVFSQVYKKCMYDGYVVEKDGYKVGTNEHYTGAHVFEPIVGVHNRVIPFDFASLYPTTIIANNICWSTLVRDKWKLNDKGENVWVRDPNIPDSMCHIFEWEDHIGCDCGKDKAIRKTRVKYIMCEKRKYRFLKNPIGILPQLLEHLLGARTQTKGLIKEVKKQLKDKNITKEEEEDLKTLLIVLDKRQQAYKVSANSAYGALGVQKGFLPLMPGAMCTTARGREYIFLTADLLQKEHNGKLIYGDTDSCYITFPSLENKSAAEIWKHALYVAEEVSKHFPAPMKLEFENTIYWIFLIIAKKKYMCLKCDEDGVISEEIEKKGCVLVRRDTSKFVRDTYQRFLLKIFQSENEMQVLKDLHIVIDNLFNNKIDIADFVITKSVKGTNDLQVTDLLTEECLDKKGNNKKDKQGNVKTRKTCKIGDYKVNALDYDDEVKFKKQMKDKKTTIPEEFYLRSLGAHVQLAEKMKRRGKPVATGTRLEYVITWDQTLRSITKDKQWEKIESADYFKEHTDVLRIDYMYYLDALSSSLDEILNVVFREKDYLHNLYTKKLEELKEETLLRPRIVLKEDDPSEQLQIVIEDEEDDPTEQLQIVIEDEEDDDLEQLNIVIEDEEN
jgi:DNA polymerase elongation subunit (family B)